MKLKKVKILKSIKSMHFSKNTEEASAFTWFWIQIFGKKSTILVNAGYDGVLSVTLSAYQNKVYMLNFYQETPFEEELEGYFKHLAEVKRRESNI